MGDKSKLYYVLLYIHGTPCALSDVPVPLPEMLGMRLEKQDRNLKVEEGLKVVPNYITANIHQTENLTAGKTLREIFEEIKTFG